MPTMSGSTRGHKHAIRIGPDVFLRPPTAADKPEYVKLRDVSETWLTPWEPTPPGQVETPEPEVIFDRVLSTANSQHFRRFMICLNPTGEIVGQLTLGHIYRGPFLNSIAGYWIGQPFANRGFATQALAMGLAEAFGPMGLHRVETNINPENAPSLRVVQKLGFRFEGLARRYLRINGEWRDHQHWAMTAEDHGELAQNHPQSEPGPGAEAPRPDRSL